jgi:hypothetical protein
MRRRPGGRVRVFVRATYLQHSRPEADGLTDLSHLSLGPSSRPSSFCGLQEQVLPLVALPELTCHFQAIACVA